MSTRRQLEEFRRITDPLADWLATATESAPSAAVSQDRLHAAYAAACLDADRPVMTKQMFGRRLRALRPEIQELQRTIAGKRQWVYLGIALREQYALRAGVPPIAEIRVEYD